jgi:hypothetical protein
VTISLSVIAGFFTVEVPSQQPDKSIDSKEQHTAEQDGEFSRSSAEVSYTLYPSMDNEHVNGRRHSREIQKPIFRHQELLTTAIKTEANITYTASSC